MIYVSTDRISQLSLDVVLVPEEKSIGVDIVCLFVLWRAPHICFR